MRIEYKPQVGKDCCTVEVSEAGLRRLAPEAFAMIRPIHPRHQTTNRPGIAWMVSTAQMVPFESRLEAAVLLSLDFEADLTAIASQPFRLSWDADRTRPWHVPDFFARRRDGSGLLVDVKPAHRLDDPKVMVQFEASRTLCDTAGWDYQVISELPEHFRRNLALLSGCRRAPLFSGEVLAVAREHLSDSNRMWIDLVAHCAAQTDLPPALVIPCLMHGLWNRELITDLSAQLSSTTIVSSRRIG